MPSTLQRSGLLHVAVIMDGNGRWATSRNLPRSAGHRAGVNAVRRIVEAAPDLGITTLTLFAFSSDNWRRPQAEVNSLMWLLRAYLRTETRRFIDSGARLIVIGRRDRLAARLRAEIRRVERATTHGQRLTVRVAIDYSSRDSILRAASKLPPGQPCSREDFTRLLACPNADANKSAPPNSEVDQLIRPTTEAAPDHWVKGSPLVILSVAKDLDGRSDDRRQLRTPLSSRKQEYDADEKSRRQRSRAPDMGAGARPCYFPVNLGARFSMNAFTPSLKSSDRVISSIDASSSRTPVARSVNRC